MGRCFLGVTQEYELHVAFKQENYNLNWGIKEERFAWSISWSYGQKKECFMVGANFAYFALNSLSGF